jgi:hypothetical protein
LASIKRDTRVSLEDAAVRAITTIQEALAQPEQEPNGYVQTVIEALYENGDPVSVDAAELLQRITAQPEQESTTDMMMELADRLGELPDDVDPRAWEHLLVYAPKREQMTDERIIAVAKATKSAEPGAWGYVLPITFARAILAADALKETT